MAQYLYSLSGEGLAEEESGDVEWDFWFARFGRRIVFCDDAGVVDLVKYESVEEARRYYSLAERDFLLWSKKNVG